MNFNLVLTASSPVQKLLWVDSIKWFKVLFPSQIRLIFCIGERADVLCTFKAQVCLDDTNDECLGPRHYHCMILPRHSLCKGISKDLNCEECFLAKASSDLFTHWYSLHKQIFTAHLQSRYEKRGLREASCLKSPGHCTTPVCTVKTPEAYQRVKASVLCAVQTAS